jgi:hypothetical protein
MIEKAPKEQIFCNQNKLINLVIDVREFVKHIKIFNNVHLAFMYSFVIPRINMSKMSENQTRHK